MRRCAWWTDLLLCLVLTSAAEARAQTAEQDCLHIPQCKTHYRRALRAYEGKQYEEAIREFQAAYEIKQVPLLLLNLGRAYYKHGQPREALRRYEQFQQAESNPDPQIKSKLTEYIAQAQATLTPDPAAPAPPPPERAPVPPEQAPQVQTPPAQSAQVQAQQATTNSPAPAAGQEWIPAGALDGQPIPPPAGPERPPRRGRPAWRIATGIIGGVLGVGLLGFGASALSVNGQCIGSPCLTRFDTVGTGAGLVAGGVVLVGAGALLLALPGSRSPTIAKLASGGRAWGLE